VQRYGIVNIKVYGDATGGSREHATGSSAYSMVKEFFRTRPQYRVSYNVREANPPVRDRVNAVNAKLCSADGVRTIFVDPKCLTTIKDLEEVVWKTDMNKNPTGQIDQADGKSHISDALGYFVEYDYGLTRSGVQMGYQPGRLI
jgi:hypothetical protein